MHFHPTERIALFIDGANLFSTTRALGFDIDFKKLLGLFRARGCLVRALYYTAIFGDQEFSSIRPLVDWLDYNGFTVVTKPAKEFVDSQGRRKIKGNMDIELTVGALAMADVADHIVLFTGDGDFRALVSALQVMGKRVSVFSTLQTHPAMVADELRRQADQFIDIGDMRSLFGRDDGKHRTGSERRSAAGEAECSPVVVRKGRKPASDNRVPPGADSAGRHE